MKNRILTVIWKELREFITLTKGQDIILRLSLLIGTLGIALPYYVGSEWLNSVQTLYYWSWFSCFLIIGPSSNLILRERTSGTYETLLASSLKDKEIYLGKLIASILYTYPMILSGMIIGCFTIHFFNGTSWIEWYTSSLFIYGNIICLLLMIIIGGVCFILTLQTANGTKVIQIMSSIILILLIPGILYAEELKELDKYNIFNDFWESYYLFPILIGLVLLSFLIFILISRIFRRTIQ